MKLAPSLVVTDEEWESLRVVRNSCRHGLTHHTEEITRDQQRDYAAGMRVNPLVRHYLYTEPASGAVAGFSRLEWRDGFVYPTYGVAPWARGKGYAWDVVRHALLAAGGPLKGDLLVTNEAIKKVDYALGFFPVGEPVDGVQQVMCPWPPPFLAGIL